MPRPVVALHPTKEELDTSTVIVDTGAAPDEIFDYVAKLCTNGIKPKHLMWILIAVPDKNLFGVPEFSQYKLA